jgi:transcriptional regulator GlxA family with amidase domain
MLSARGLAFVQRAQLAVLAYASDDYVCATAGIWDCLRSFPSHAPGADLAGAIITVGLLASRYFDQPSHHAPQPPCPGISQSRSHVARLLRLAHQWHASQRLSLGMLAEEMRLSAQFLSRALAIETAGLLHVREHINGIRILAAIKHLQVCRQLDCAEIARNVGYASTAELDRQFARSFNTSPRECRCVLQRPLLGAEIATRSLLSGQTARGQNPIGRRGQRVIGETDVGSHAHARD